MKRLHFFCLITCLSTAILVNGQDSTRKELVGKYKFPAGSVVEDVQVAIENGALTMSSSAGVSALEPMKGDTFNIVSFNGIAVFKRNETKQVTGVHIDASGYVLDGIKDSAATHLAMVTYCKPVDNNYNKAITLVEKANSRIVDVYYSRRDPRAKQMD